jgi:predicted CXXCH cytochrome family protein
MRWLMWCGIAAFVLALAVPAEAQPAGRRHDDCRACHTADPPSAGNLAAAGHDALCSSCHGQRARPGAEHPVGMAVPSHRGRLPLPQGLLACTTCHDWHGAPGGALRLPREQLCPDCHE